MQFVFGKRVHLQTLERMQQHTYAQCGPEVCGVAIHDTIHLHSGLYLLWQASQRITFQQGFT